jgi:4-amino-4-deoxy-L-arabinose transferase-like glycosyltransferase
MDDVDAVQAQIARNMLDSGDWVTARLDGVAYLEKAPLVYWMMAASYRLFGVHDWAARLPLALGVVLLCFVVYRFGRWAFGEDAGMYAGVALATSAGLFLFTRILIPDALLTLAITGAAWAWLRLLEPDEDRPRRWAIVLGVCLGCGLLLKGLIAVVFPVLAGVAYMAARGRLFSAWSWGRLRLGWVIAVALVIAAPWHVLAIVRNPPYFAFSLHSGPGEYRGFFWFYFFNEHLLRFLNLRYPRDYDTVPRLWFWLLNLVWLFPWSAWLPGALKLEYGRASRAARVRLMAVCWIAVVMVFFTFSTTQEYYSMPIYPALALLIGSALAQFQIRRIPLGVKQAFRPADKQLSEEASAAEVNGYTITGNIGTWTLIAVATALFVALSALLLAVRHVPAPGDISQALSPHPEMYTLSLGHMGDLTLRSFAYLKLPLALAALAFAGMALAPVLWRGNVRRAVFAVAVSMVVFVQAARMALVRFDPSLGSFALAQSLKQTPPGGLIADGAYYGFSSVFFYTGRNALLLNGRSNNLEYGSYAPNAPQVFIDDSKFVALWSQPERYYLLASETDMQRLRQLVGRQNLHAVKESGGNCLLTNRPLP